jgi:cell division protein FtsQ
MKPVVRYLIAASAVAACVFLALVGDRVGAKNRHEVTCNSVDALIADSLQRKFISPDDIKDWMADYGTYLGLRLDSVDLRRVEAVIDGKSAVRKSEAWLTDDGVLHISVTQREPVVRFQSASGGYYADADGFLFPLQLRHTARVPVVDGHLPLKLGKDFKGEPGTEKERQWVLAVIDLVRYLGEQKEWNDLVGQITVDKNGNLVLIPREGTERFVFGTPTDIDAKFGRVRKYYESIAPSQENSYQIVDVRYKDQVICRRNSKH